MDKNKATPPNQRMDLLELMAHDLEFRQKQRYRQTKFKVEFYERNVEKQILQQIKDFRATSETWQYANRV